MVRECFCSGGCRSCAIFRAIFSAGPGPVFVSILDATGGSVFRGSLGDVLHAVFGTVRVAVHDALFIQIFCFVLDP